MCNTDIINDDEFTRLHGGACEESRAQPRGQSTDLQRKALYDKLSGVQATEGKTSANGHGPSTDQCRTSDTI